MATRVAEDGRTVDTRAADADRGIARSRAERVAGPGRIEGRTRFVTAGRGWLEDTFMGFHRVIGG